MKSDHEWKFKSHFRSRAFGWNGTSLAVKRLKEAVSEIKKSAKKDPVLAADGAIYLMGRIWPALQFIDGSSGSLGCAVDNTLDGLIPFIISAQVDKATRAEWTERLFKAVQNEGVSFLSPVEDRWGEICVFTELINEWLDRLLPGLIENFSSEQYEGYYVGTDICLSCLLEAHRYEDLENILSLKKRVSWSHARFYAESLLRRGMVDEAVYFAETKIKDNYDLYEINEFCERVLIQAGRKDEAYYRYGLSLRKGMTYLAQFKSIVKKYPERMPRNILEDLLQGSENKAAWFTSARQSGFIDLAMDCALSGYVDPRTLIRAARDTIESESQFSSNISLRALDLILFEGGYDLTLLDVADAFHYLMESSERIGSRQQALDSLRNMLSNQSQKSDAVVAKHIEHLIKIRTS